MSESWVSVSVKESDWFSKQSAMAKKVVSTMPAQLQVNYKAAVKTGKRITVCSSEVFYVPQHFVSDFIDLVNLVGDQDIHYKIAIPMFFLSMDSPQNFDPVLNTMIYKKEPAVNSSTLYSPKVSAVHPWNVSGEPDFIKLIRIMAEGDPLLMELV